MLASTESPGYFREPLAPKVPEITVLFWLIKVLTTGMGESTSDYLAGLNRVLAGAAVMVGFAIAMWLQFRTRRYVAAVYWFAVAMVAVAGTVAADILHIGFGIPYLDSTIFYALVVAAIFWLWYRSQGTLSIHSIVTRTRELYYWLTVLATFALGTAAGDLTAASMHLGYRTSAVLFAVLIAVPAIGWRKFRLNPVLAFWCAYIITRPLGVSIADWLGKRRSLSGIGWGDGPVAAVAAIVIAILVGYLAIARTDIQPGIDQGVRSAGPG